jgi:hypothetical protein
MDELEPVKPLPHTREIPVPELGPDVSFTMVNPWMLPEGNEPIMAPLSQRDGEGDESYAARLEQRRQDLRRQKKERLSQLIVSWRGITDMHGKALPAPRENPDVFDTMPSIIHVKLAQALNAMELDMEWDPTKRPTPQTETTASPTQNANTSRSRTKSEPTPARTEPDSLL